MSQLSAFFASVTLEEWAKEASRLVIVTVAVLALIVGAEGLRCGRSARNVDS